jgi:hypothetical protein
LIRWIIQPLALLAVLICDAATADAQPCQGTPADLQALRDNLEIVRVQVKAARNETGYEKKPATDAVDTAIRTLEEAAGHAIEPSPSSKVATTPRGAVHPHMQVVHQAFPAAERAFERVRCALPGPIAPLQKAMTDLEQALQFR